MGEEMEGAIKGIVEPKFKRIVATVMSGKHDTALEKAMIKIIEESHNVLGDEGLRGFLQQKVEGI
jgi:hypothetical protein